MNQPTKKEITKKVELVLSGKLTREELYQWANEFIRNDDSICINDIDAWHYLVEISNLDEMIAPEEYLFNEDDIRSIVGKYCY